MQQIPPTPEAQTRLLECLGSPGAIVTDAETVQAFIEAAPAAQAGDSHYMTAIRRALCSDRPAFGILSGHQAAMRTLLPGLPAAGIVAFCASEARGAHPRYIETSLEETEKGLTLTGQKRWASLAPSADHLVIIATRGRSEARNQLVPVLVDANRSGIGMSLLDAPGLAPEILHAVVDLEAVQVHEEDVLPLDGYTEAVRPFRSYEDLYIAAALQACSLRHGLDFGWPEELVEDILACLLAMTALAGGSLVSPLTHIGLASVARMAAQLNERKRPYWHETPGGEHWVSETSAPPVAAKAKARRREVAWERFRNRA